MTRSSFHIFFFSYRIYFRSISVPLNVFLLKQDMIRIMAEQPQLGKWTEQSVGSEGTSFCAIGHTPLLIKSPEAMINHYKLLHSSSAPTFMVCPICIKMNNKIEVFKWSTSLKSHMDVHAKEEDGKCLTSIYLNGKTVLKDMEKQCKYN